MLDNPLHAHLLRHAARHQVYDLQGLAAGERVSR